MSDRFDYDYPREVGLDIQVGDQSAYLRAADSINSSGFDVLSVQHEYGIFGGEAGSYLIGLLRETKMPIVTTLHTVLLDPSPAQKSVMEDLLQLSERVVVMSQKAIEFLELVHGFPREKIDLIPHGIPHIPATAGQELRREMDITGPMIMTFGLLSPDKGIQFVIEAMPKILESHPDAVYVVVGATHPHVKASAGEAYRDSLVALAIKLGVEGSVRFVDRFVSIEELVNYIGATDIYTTPYLNPRQITSGTLAYALGSGKAVISSPYWYAEELLDDERGILVPFRDSNAISDAVLKIEGDLVFRQTLEANATAYGLQMSWPEVGKRYLESFAKARKDSAARLRGISHKPVDAFRSIESLPTLRLDHLIQLSDDTGILQHATFTTPNRSEGYCADDNARALLLTAYIAAGRVLPPDIALLQSRYLSFLLDAFNPKNGRFRNFMSYDRSWLEDAGSEDSHGRSLWALGATVNRCLIASKSAVAHGLFKSAMLAMEDMTSPRTWAYGILAADEFLACYPFDHEVKQVLQLCADKLYDRYRINEEESWDWFEQSLSYANARLPQALIVAGKKLGDKNMLESGVRSLRWLMALQTGPGGVFAPIGANGFYTRFGDRSFYDQQPIEASASLSACLAAYRATADLTWYMEAQRAFGWFLGVNMLGLPLYDEVSAGCHDGLHEERLNQNQGAESTLSYLCALAELRNPAVWIARGFEREGNYGFKQV